MDTILWKEESDAYTQRAIQDFGIEGIYSSNEKWAENFKNNVSPILDNCNTFCDIGCSYGGVISSLSKFYPNSKFYGIDPGHESIEIAKKSINSKNADFFQGHSHELPVEEQSVDVVILRMVLQWIPRNKLYQTISEIDRILKPNGIVWLQDFLPNKPLTSKSKHKI